MKKITADFHKTMEQKIPKTKRLVLNLENEEYEVNIKNFLTLEEKTALLTEVIEMVSEEEVAQIAEAGGATLLLMLIYKALTDIEFPEKTADKVAQFTWLLDTGALQKIHNNIRPGLVEELGNFLTLSLEEARKLIEEKSPR